VTDKENTMSASVSDIAQLLDNDTDQADNPAARRVAKDLIRQWFLTLRGKDLSALLATMSDDIVIELPFSETGRTENGAFRRYVGQEEVRSFWEAAMKAEGKSHGLTEVDLTITADGSVVFFEAKGDMTMANGKSYKNRYVFRFSIVNGKISKIREYYNPIISAYAFGRPIAGKFLLDSL
jgi:uncharacterized protein